MTDQQKFQNSSTTYFTASRFFPAHLRDDVTKLYAFVRAADDFVDEQPQRRDKLDELEWAWHGGEIDDENLQRLARQMRQLCDKYHWQESWVEAFFASMRMDLAPARRYQTLTELDEYIYGSAEVIGLMMARMFGLDESYDAAARAQGSAMQLMNFVRDMREDTELKRRYVPGDMMHEVGLRTISKRAVHDHEPAFRALVARLIDEYRRRQAAADAAIVAIPLEMRAPLQVAIDGYNYTARIIEYHPLVIWERKVKPPKWWLVAQGIRRRFL